MVLNSLNKYKIYNTTKEDITKEIKSMKKYINKCLKLEHVKSARFSIIIIDNKQIKEINTKYRNIEKETDVISFALEDEKEENFFINKRLLGDIYISLEKAKQQSKEYGHSLERELSFLSVHGLLHLLGYDHMKKEDEKIMFEKQEMILDGKQR